MKVSDIIETKDIDVALQSVMKQAAAMAPPKRRNMNANAEYAAAKKKKHNEKMKNDPVYRKEYEDQLKAVEQDMVDIGKERSKQYPSLKPRK